MMRPTTTSSVSTSKSLEEQLAAKVTHIMRHMRSGPKQLRALAEELDARQKAKRERREIDLVHDPSAQLDESDRNGETSQRPSRPPFQPRDRY